MQKAIDKPHQRLLCWQKSMELVVLIYEITEKFPKSETFSLTSQIRRAAISVPANITEGAADRTSGQFKHYLGIAVGSLNELATLIEIAKRVGYLDESAYQKTYGLLDNCLALTFGLKKSLR